MARPGLSFNIKAMSEERIPMKSDLGIPLPTKDYNSDDSSEEEDADDAVKLLYSKLPEDLGFTLVGLNFEEEDFKVIRNLRLDLNTFMTLSEKDLLELGVKESFRIKRFIKSTLLKNGQCLNIFTKGQEPVDLTSEDVPQLYANSSAVVHLVEKSLQEMRFTLHQNPPLNYQMSRTVYSRDIFIKAQKVLLEQITKGYNVAERQSKQLDELSDTQSHVVPTKSNVKKRRKLVLIKRTIVICSFSALICAIVKLVRPLIK